MDWLRRTGWRRLSALVLILVGFGGVPDSLHQWWDWIREAWRLFWGGAPFSSPRPLFVFAALALLLGPEAKTWVQRSFADRTPKQSPSHAQLPLDTRFRQGSMEQEPLLPEDVEVFTQLPDGRLVFTRSLDDIHRYLLQFTEVQRREYDERFADKWVRLSGVVHDVREVSPQERPSEWGMIKWEVDVLEPGATMPMTARFDTDSTEPLDNPRGALVSIPKLRRGQNVSVVGQMTTVDEADLEKCQLEYDPSEPVE